MPTENKNSDIWTQAAKNYMRRKLKELIKQWQQERKENGLPWTLTDLAKELHYGHRNSITNWINGNDQPPLDLLCDFFKVEHSFFVAQNLDELDIMDERHHKKMQKQAADIAAEYEVSQSFLWYLKSDEALQDMILNKQPTDAILNSFDTDVPDVGSPYQFITLKGEKAYLNEYSLSMLGKIEKRVKEYIEFELWREYKRREENRKKHSNE